MKIVLLLLIPVFLWADEVFLQNGTKYAGKIISADQNYIYLQLTDTTTAKIPHALAKSVFFNYSDLVYLLSGEVIECKIVNEIITDLLIITTQGPVTIKVVNIKKYFYNTADSLLIPFLPPTGKVFNNQEILEPPKEIFRKHLLLGFNTGISFTPAAEWEGSFYKGKDPLGFTTGVIVEYPLQSYLITHLGYEYILYKNISKEYLPAQIHRYLFFGGLAYKHKFLVPRHSYYSVGISIGSNWIKGSHQISGSHPDITLNTLDNMGSRVAVRTYLAVEAFIWGQLMLRFQYTYMFMKSFHYQPTPNYPEKINLDFSGPALGISLFFQIPLSK